MSLISENLDKYPEVWLCFPEVFSLIKMGTVLENFVLHTRLGQGQKRNIISVSHYISVCIT